MSSGLPDAAGNLRGRDLAMHLAANGLAVFPCGADKRPWTPRGVYSASTDPRVVALMPWSPRACVGLATGSRSGIDVLDLDVRGGQAVPAQAVPLGAQKVPLPMVGAVDGFATLAALGLTLPETCTAATPSGGRHYWFHHIPGSRSRVLGPGLEWFSEGKFVVLPPAPGRAWLHFGEIAEAPAALSALVLARPGLPSALPSRGTLCNPSGKARARAPAPMGSQLPKPIYLQLLRLVPAPPATRKQQRRLREALRFLAAKRSARNAALHWAACRAAEGIAEGWLSPPAAVDLLTMAAKANGYFQKDGEAAVQATIASGFSTNKETMQ